MKNDPMIPQCRAKSKSTHKPCKRYPCKNGRCHLHGGHSTGPRTLQGKHNQRVSVFKHGFYAKEAVKERRAVKELLREV